MDALFSQPLHLVVIFGLTSAVIFLVRHIITLYAKIDQLQETRLLQSREDKETLLGPMQEQTKLSEKIYDLLISSSKRGR